MLIEKLETAGFLRIASLELADSKKTHHSIGYPRAGVFRRSTKYSC